ncbi:MAG TPA: hypothetical protein VHP12_07975, partial [Chitinophagaceae bacterium]|nr:hypothetical protein [Chitinophagaceae bacterium]
LFPNNNSNGNLEDVLSSITVRHDLIDCFQQYEQCVNHYPQKLNHSRIYSYLDMILYPNAIVNGKDLRKEEFRNYRNHTHWNLHHEYLDPLYSFLSPYFQAQ